MIVGLGSYYRTVLARAWRDTIVFSRNQIIVSLIGTLLVAGGLYWWNADPSVTSGAIFTVLAACLIVAVTLMLNIIVAPWRLHHEVAGRLEQFERRPDVGRLVELREEGVQLLNRRVQREQELPAVWEALREWENRTVAELEKCATKGDVSWFRVLGTFPAKALPGFPTKYTLHDHEMAMLSERLDRLFAIISRI